MHSISSSDVILYKYVALLSDLHTHPPLHPHTHTPTLTHPPISTPTQSLTTEEGAGEGEEAEEEGDEGAGGELAQGVVLPLLHLVPPYHVNRNLGRRNGTPVLESLLWRMHQQVQ